MAEVKLLKVDDESYSNAAKQLRLDVVYLMASVGLSDNGLGVTAHQVLLQPDSQYPPGLDRTMNVLVHSKRLSSSPAKKSAIHIVTNEELERTISGDCGIFVSHTYLSPGNHARIRFYGEVILGESGEYAELPEQCVEENSEEDEVHTPIFNVCSNGSLDFDPLHLEHIRTSSVDEYVFGLTKMDKMDTLLYGRSILSQLSKDNYFYKEAIS